MVKLEPYKLRKFARTYKDKTWSYPLTNIVFPFPGGPNSSMPLAGDLRPVNNCVWGGNSKSW